MIFEARRWLLAQRWGLTKGVVLIYGGSAVPVPGCDQHHPFHPHPDLVYLTGHGAPRLVLAYDAAVDSGVAGDTAWQLFSYRSTADEMVWEQPAETLGRPLDELPDWLDEHSTTSFTLLGAPLDAALSAALPMLSAAQPALSAALPSGAPTTESTLVAELTADLTTERIHKDAAAVVDLNAAAACSTVGFDWVFRNVTTGMTEREVQVGLEAGFFAAGAPRVAYDSIVASGPNSAVLHYVPSATEALCPSTRTIGAGDLLLIDAGAQVGGYASDVTRTMVVGAEPTDEQEFLWRLVLRTQELAIERCIPGQEWREVHLDAARTIGAGLVEFGLLRGEPDELVSIGAVALFYPHGLGHLIGLAVHDVGGYAPGRERSTHPQLRYLRTDRPLEAGMVTSVEPGVYFIEVLLDDPQMRARFASEVVWERVDELRGFGGIRMEDDVLVTEGEPEVLSSAISKPIRIG